MVATMHLVLFALLFDAPASADQRQEEYLYRVFEDAWEHAMSRYPLSQDESQKKALKRRLEGKFRISNSVPGPVWELRSATTEDDASQLEMRLKKWIAVAEKDLAFWKKLNDRAKVEREASPEFENLAAQRSLRAILEGRLAGAGQPFPEARRPTKASGKSVKDPTWEIPVHESEFESRMRQAELVLRRYQLELNSVRKREPC